MKKYLPLVLLLVGILIFAGVFLFVKNRGQNKPVDENDESALIEVPLEKRPVVTLVPTGDGHYMKMKIDKIMVPGVAKIDYIMEYQTAAEITQGVSGEEDLNGSNTYEREFLFGTESSGKFRYDEGVEKGAIDFKFRNSEGKLIAKFRTDFHMQTGVTDLTSQDGKFTYKLDSVPKGVYFITLHTIGQPEGDLKAIAEKDGYAVFASDGEAHPGNIQ